MENKLNELVDKICAYHSEHDTKDFYQKVHMWLAECLSLLDFSLLQRDEIDLISQSREILKRNDLNEIKEKYDYISSRWNPKQIVNKKRQCALRSIMSVYMTFDDYKDDECYRAETLEFIVGFLLGAGVNPDKIYSVLYKEFVNIF